MLLCVFFGLTNQVCKYFEFLSKTYLVFENLKGECLKTLILGKLGLKLVFWKNISSHTHAFYSLYSMLWEVFFKNQFIFIKKIPFFQNFNWSNLFFVQSKLCLKLWWSLCLFWSIKTVVSINQTSRIRFLKNSNLTCSNHFFKTFSLSLSPTQQGSTTNFLSFSS